MSIIIISKKYFIKLIKLGVSNNCELVTTSKYSKNGLKKIFINKKITYIYQSSERVYYNNKINKSVFGDPISFN